MRDIKVRVWDRRREQFMKLDSIDFEEEIINENGVWRYFSEVIITEYTGLKDKNGVEIYEGDVLRIDNIYNSQGYRKEDVVIMETAYFQLDGNPLYMYSRNHIEIVGHIF